MVDAAPFLTVIIPCRNEARYIGRTLNSVLAALWPRDRMEVLVVDGMSDDGTREVVREYAARDGRVKLLDNPGLYAGDAMNAGIAAAIGDYVARVDGHGEVPPTYFQKGVAILQSRPEVWAVGGPMTWVGEEPEAEFVAAVMASDFATGNANRRGGERDDFVDAVAYPIWRREVFDRVGMFDAAFVRNQDDDFDLRIHAAGGRVFQTASMRCVYYVRSSVRKLLIQYRQYGFWKVPLLKKHRRLADWKPFVPVGFFSSLLAAAGGGVFFRPLWWVAAALLFFYLLLDIAAASVIGRKLGVAGFLRACFVFPAIHFNYALGFAVGLWFAVILRRSAADLRGRGLFASLNR